MHFCRQNRFASQVPSQAFQNRLVDDRPDSLKTAQRDRELSNVETPLGPRWGSNSLQKHPIFRKLVSVVATVAIVAAVSVFAVVATVAVVVRRIPLRRAILAA
jgi:hypothetical protein